ncbi:MAG: adenylate kinase family protein [Candidatus Asgardarchaeia archaeon]
MLSNSSNFLIIVITGTPGVGKTVIAKKLAKKISGIYFSLNEFIFKNKLVTFYDNERKSWVINEQEVVRQVSSYLMNLKRRSHVIVDTHMGELLDPAYVDFVFVLRTNPNILEKRLTMRKDWHRQKIIENVQSEILGVVSYNILQRFPREKIFEIDTSETSPDEVVAIIIKILQRDNSIDTSKYRRIIDWLSDSESLRYFSK